MVLNLDRKCGFAVRLNSHQWVVAAQWHRSAVFKRSIQYRGGSLPSVAIRVAASLYSTADFQRGRTAATPSNAPLASRS